MQKMMSISNLFLTLRHLIPVAPFSHSVTHMYVYIYINDTQLVLYILIKK